jgi:hypothetical protein
MTKARVILSAVVLAVLFLPILSAAEPAPSPAEAAPAVSSPVCDASLVQPIFPELPALPDQPVQPISTACNWTCTAQCDQYYQSCIAGCSGYRGDPCLTDCRNGRTACYSGCC